MLGNFFKQNFPDKYINLAIKNHIQSNYNYYNVDRLELCSLSMIYNIHSRKVSDTRNKLVKLNDEKYILVSKNPNTYPINNFSYYEVIHSIAILKNLNIIREKIGFRNYKEKKKNNEWFYQDSTATKIFLNPYEDWDIHALNLDWYNFSKIIFCSKAPNNKIFIRFKEKIKEKRDKYYFNNLREKVYEKKIVNGKEVNKQYTFTKKINHDFLIKDYNLNKNLNTINKFLIDNDEESLQYKRIYGENLSEYGRFYNSFQTIPKVLRKKILEEKDWIELDYTSCFINTLYLIESGKTYSGDIYSDILEKIGMPYEFRKLIKEILIIALNTSDKSSAIKSIRKILVDNGLYNKSFKEEFSFFYPISSIPEDFLYSHKVFLNNFESDVYYLLTPNFLISIFESIPIINKYLFSNSSGFTQNIESNTISNVMLKMIEDNIIPLSIHDCIIIPSEYKIKYELIMIDLLKKECDSFKYKSDIYNLYQYKLNLSLYSPAFILRNFTMLYTNRITFRVLKNEYG